MKQIIYNYLTVFGFPIILGLAFRIIFRKSQKGWIVSAVFGAISVIMGILALTVNTYGNETLGLLTISSLTATAVSLVCGGVIKLRSKRKDSK